MNNIQNYGMTNYQTGFNGTVNKKMLTETIGLTEKEVKNLLRQASKEPQKTRLDFMTTTQFLDLLKASEGAKDKLNKTAVKIENADVNLFDSAKNTLEAIY